MVRSEWLKEHAWKVCMFGNVSGVRIPSLPYLKKSSYENAGFFSHVARLREDENLDPGSTKDSSAT